MMSFQNAKVLAFESRRSKEMAELIRINGGEPLMAPAVEEIPLEHNEQAFAFADRLHAGAFGMMIFLTGVGARYLDTVLSSRDDAQRFREALRRLTVVARGPKPVSVLREWNVPVTVTVPEPNTWRELLAAIETCPEKTVAVQEYGRTNSDLVDGLEAQGRMVTRVPVYRWTLPEDTAPLAAAIDQLLRGTVAVALFTTGVQAEHFFDFAGRTAKQEAVRNALQKVFLASIGPTCSESLRSCGLNPAMEPSHPKMGILVREAAQRFSTSRTADAPVTALPPR